MNGQANTIGQEFRGAAPAPAPERIINVFDVPPSLQEIPVELRVAGGDETITSIGIVELTPQEEMMAARRAGNDPTSLAFELWKQSLAEVNGKRCTLGDGTTDIWVAQFRSAVRTLAMTAYGEVNTPTQKEVGSFLKSRRRKV